MKNQMIKMAESMLVAIDTFIEEKKAKGQEPTIELMREDVVSFIDKIKNEDPSNN